MPSTLAVTRLTLLPSGAEPGARDAGQPKVRRYRLARVRQPDTRPAAERFAHLTRSYD